LFKTFLLSLLIYIQKTFIYTDDVFGYVVHVEFHFELIIAQYDHVTFKNLVEPL